ncbi:hypothetical protein Godav_011286 [Gossypium davidsonii]|uniref:Uncharacterized protein n=2 Tax=Gossypium TaxID=3633 RepID=A0A7J8R9B1_GOSDV|nr:hypothetical protein [Gossypium davidsonii]MBA0645517.1 hypothetical protein [Gossypium klotzschianum]
MQKKGKDLQRVGICQGIFNFIINSLVGFSLKRVTLGHPMPRGSTNESQEPLINQAKLDENPMIDDSGSAVRIHFKQTEEELEDWNWTHVDKLGSSVHAADKDDGDDEAMEKRNKEIPRLSGVSLDTDEPQQVHGKTGRRVIIPITDSEGTKSAKALQSDARKPTDARKPMLTGLGFNINEISETFIQNTKERLSRNISLMEPEES